MRQAVPLLRPEAPIVGTGLEARVARDSRVLLMLKVKVLLNMLMQMKSVYPLQQNEDERLSVLMMILKRYQLTKFRKTNQSTCINLKPIVKKGEKVKRTSTL
jgi:DNA-directed RNA polymerase subunit beta